MQEAKTCTGCREEKTASVVYFLPDKRYRNGLTSRCRECLKAYQRGWQRKWKATEDGKRAHRALNRKWETTQHGRAKLRAAKKAWRERNRQKIARRQRELRAEKRRQGL